MAHDRPVLSVTIVLYNCADWIRDCIGSFRDDIVSGYAELLVVDNASMDDSAKIVEEEFPEAKLIRSSTNRGFAAGCNLAWPFVRSDYWLLLNPDTVLPQGALRQLVTWMDLHSDIGAGSPRLVSAEGKPIHLSLAFPSLLRAILETSRLHKLLPARVRGRFLHIPELSREESVYVDWVPGTALIVRRQVVQDVGLLCEDLFLYAEDVEWCWRIRRFGWHIAVHRPVSVRHIGGASSLRSVPSQQLARMSARNCYVVDERICGAIRARLLVCVRALGLAIESVHPTRSIHQRRRSRVALAQNIKLLIGQVTGATSK